MLAHEKISIYLTELVLIDGTRAMLGAGVALILTENMEKKNLHLLGWTLAMVGAVTTVPLVMVLLAENRSKENPPACLHESIG